LPREQESAMVTATRRGFTVIELLAALTLIGILAGIALPAWNKYLLSFELSTSARLVHSELQSLKIRSAAENVSFRLAYAMGATNIEIQRDGKTWAVKPLPNGVSITKAGSIAFSPRGTAGANRVRLMNRDGVCQQVVVSPTGRVRTCKVSCGSDC
jgi:prepilin-type N-terminal cleavage/methylation domain-containing protein